MKKHVAIITFSSYAAKTYYNQLSELFGEKIILEQFSFEDNNIGKICADLVVVASNTIYYAVKKHIPENSEVVVINVTLAKRALEKLRQISQGTKALLVNISMEMAIETISLIYSLGINHLELVPYYPGIKDIPHSKYAITPGEIRYVPEGVENIINVGNRLLDTNTVIEIALKLGMERTLSEQKFKTYFDSIATKTESFVNLANRTNRLESQFDILLTVLSDGIIGVNAEGLIFAFNTSAEKIIGMKCDKVIGEYAKKVLPEVPFDEVFKTFKPIKSKLIKIDGKYLSLEVVPVVSANILQGAFAIIRGFKDSEYQQHKLRAQLLKKGHRAKYTFDDIIGESPSITKTKEIAKKMARSNSSILITGESGTGKELFAQAIHNESDRKNFPFVAINCAAIPENLLETELFGYEEGAFTGAKKGGKIGLFEFAHMGTLFLDEVGEMSLNLQTKLLRPLEEKEVMRIGGDEVINVDVRIIAATNRDLNRLVNQGSFRKDLYYRLNVLPLYIPPLRDRKEDIPFLFNQIKKELGFKFDLSKAAREILLNHQWEGNVRELRNYVEYMAYIGGEAITVDDLPFTLSKTKIQQELDEKEHEIIEEFKKRVSGKLNEYIFVLEILDEAYKKRKGMGRRSLAQKAEKRGVFLTEQEIRTILLDLQEYNMVTISVGRGGSKISELGKKTIKVLEKGLNG